MNLQEKAKNYANRFVANPREELAPWQEEIAQHYAAGFKDALNTQEVLDVIIVLRWYANQCPEHEDRTGDFEPTMPPELATTAKEAISAFDKWEGSR